jgi:hypothetical protein
MVRESALASVSGRSEDGACLEDGGFVGGEPRQLLEASRRIVTREGHLMASPRHAHARNNDNGDTMECGHAMNEGWQ